MVVSARHLHRRSLRDAGERDDAAARSPLGATRRRQSQPQSTGQSSSVLGALSDENSKLSRFLFIGGGGEETRSDDMPSMRMWDAAFMALALEPLEIRNERIIMLFEAYAIFGALLLNGVWVVYEWGSWKGYGGDGSNIVVERVFECIMAMAISRNVFLALWGAMYWVHSITTNSSHQDYVIDSIRPLVYLHYLLMALETLVLLGVLLGIYINLSPHWPETIVALSAALAVSVGGITTYCRHDMTCSPLEFYHFPTWLRYSNPHYGSRRERDALRVVQNRGPRSSGVGHTAKGEKSTPPPKQSAAVRLEPSSMKLRRIWVVRIVTRPPLRPGWRKIGSMNPST